MLNTAHAHGDRLVVRTEGGTDIIDAIKQTLDRAAQLRNRDIYYFGEDERHNFAKLINYYRWAIKQGQAYLHNERTLERYVQYGAGLHRCGLLFSNRCPTRTEINQRVEEDHLDQGAAWHGENAADYMVSTKELKEAQISYNMRGEESRFQREIVSWEDQFGRKVVVEVDGELNGIGDTDDTHGPQNEEFEPLHVEEALEFIDYFLAPWEEMDEHRENMQLAAKGLQRLRDAKASEIALRGAEQILQRAQEAYRKALATIPPETIAPLLRQAVAVAQDENDAVREHNHQERRVRKVSGSPGPKGELPGQIWKRSFDPHSRWAFPSKEDMELLPPAPFADDLPRARACVSRHSLGQMWNHDGSWFIGERSGVVEDISAQNDDKYSRLAQEVEGSWQEELDRRAAKEVNLFDQLFYRGGEKFGRKRRDGRKVARSGENRMWSDWHRYIRRQAHGRVERCAELLWKVLTYPLEDVRQHLGNNGGVIRERYKKSVKECAPGPFRRRENNQWLTLPATGEQARLLLIQRGFNPQHITPRTRFWKGECWHKLYLDGQQMEVLQGAINQRLQGRQYPGVRPQETCVPATAAQKLESLFHQTVRRDLTKAWSQPLSKGQPIFKLRGSWSLEEALATASKY